MKRKRKRERHGLEQFPQAMPEWEHARIISFAKGVTAEIMPFLAGAYLNRDEESKLEARRLLTWAFDRMDWEAQETWNPAKGSLLLEMMKGEEVKFSVQVDLTPLSGIDLN